MPTFERCLDVEVPPQRVWAFLSDFGHWESFLTVRGYLRKRSNRFHLSENSVAGVGGQVVMTAKDSVVMTWTIREWEPPKKLVMDSQFQSWPVSYRAALLFEIIPKTSLTTELRVRFDFEPKSSILALSTSMLSGRMERQLEMLLKQFAAVLQE